MRNGGRPHRRADAPGLSNYVWYVPALGFSDCMQRATKAVQQLGVADVHQKPIEVGLGFVDGVLGDYYIEVICLTSKGTVITVVTGDDYTTSDNYRRQIDTIMGNGSSPSPSPELRQEHTAPK
jgi:hypothetical protein